MISSSMYPCVIQEFEQLLPLEAACRSGQVFAVKECALNNLNALRLRGSSLGRYRGSLLATPAPDGRAQLSRGAATVGTWEPTATDTGGPGTACPSCQCKAADRSPEVDANCNNPEERCRSCRNSAAPSARDGWEAPPDARPLSPASSPSTSSTTSSSSSPLSSCSNLGSDASPNAVSRDRLAFSDPAGKPQGPAVSSYPSPSSSPSPEPAEVGSSGPHPPSGRPGSSQEPAGAVEPGPDINQNVSPAPRVRGQGSAKPPDPGTSSKTPPAASDRTPHRPTASPCEGVIGKLPPLQPQPPNLPSGQLGLAQPREAVSEDPGRAQVSLSPFDEALGPSLRAPGAPIMAFEEARLRPAAKAPPRNITSFHQMAQKRRQSAAAKIKEDKSDWLMAFSPDTELPPRLRVSAQVRAGAAPESPGKGATQNRQREVTTFRELRYQSHVGRWGPPHCATRDGAQHGSEAGGQGPRPAGVKGSEEMDGRRLADPGAGRRESSADATAGQLGGRRVADKPRGSGGTQHAGDHPSAEGRGESRTEESAGANRGSGRARGTADGRDKSIKEGLLWAVNVSVDKIVSHFSVARNIVQKAQLGDSRTNPSVGQLVLGDLCPALDAVLRDGLKPHQQDLIVGRRPNSPWSVVEASVKAGPPLRTLYSLYSQLDQLSQLSNSQKKFNAFIFGLLNLKLLDFWISGLHGCPEVLRTHYAPTAFLSLSHGPCRVLFEELLLLLQPLSVLAFQLDPLFEYHHQFLADQRAGGSQPELRGLGQQEPSGTQRGRPGAEAGGQEQPWREARSNPAEEEDNPRGRAEARVPRTGRAAEGASVTRRPSTPGCPGGDEGPGYTLQQTFDQVVQWGDRLTQTLLELKKPPARPRLEEQPPASPAEPGVKRELSWWEHLGQSSQIYLSPAQEGSVFAKWMKPKATDWKAHSLFELSERESAATKQAAAGRPVARDCGGQLRNSGPAPRSCDGGGSSVAQKDNADTAKDGQQDPVRRGGDPPEETEEASATARGPASFQSDLDRKALFRTSDKLWLGRLFGAKVPGTYSPGDPPPHQAKAPRGRLPSDWLQVSINPFEQLLKTPPAGRDQTPRPLEINPPAQEPSKPARMVRTLCDHTATEEDHLSFRRGATLEILACVDEDWIRCSHGDASGLVPIGYTSLV